jgi:cation diffusion facilitator family transporter
MMAHFSKHQVRTAPTRSHAYEPTQRIAFVSLTVAAVLVLLTLGTGLLTGSLGLISSGVESSGDVVAALLTLFALRLSGRPADADHNYGHRRAENLAALGEAAIITGGGIVVVVAAIERLVGAKEMFTPRWYVFSVIGVAIAVDCVRTIISLRSAEKYNSTALRANAIHFASDIAGAVAVLVGLIAVSDGLKQGDAVAALVVAVIIFTAAARLIYGNARVLMDTAPADAQARAREAITALTGVELRRLRLRESGGRYFVEAVVAVPPHQAIVMGHTLADEVESAVRVVLPESDVIVHLEPQLENLEVRERALALALGEPLVREAHDITIYEHEGEVSVSLHLKLMADVPLSEAHDVAERVEAALRKEPGVASVHTHLEPLERPLAAAPGQAHDAGEEKRINDLVCARTGENPRELLLLTTEGGRVVFVTVGVGVGVSLADAHEIAGRLEDDIRRDQPHMADVVVHTEP